MNRKSQGLLLLTLATLAAISAIMVQTYATSNSNSVLSDSPALYAYDVSGVQSNSTCRPPPQPGNQIGAMHQSPPWMNNLTEQQKQTLNQTVTTMKASGATRQQIMNAVNDLLKQWGINVPQNPRPPPQGPMNSTSGTPPPPPWMANSTDPHHPPPPMTNQTDTPRPPPPWMGNLTTQQRQTIDETVRKLQASGATPEQIRSAVDALLKQWGIAIPQCH